MASSRRTYDTDVITLRTVFAKNPGNSNVPALRTLTADGAGGTYWAVPSTLGVNPAFNQIITSGGTYTADLSYNTFRLTAAENIGMTDGPPGSNQTYIYAKAFSQMDVSGENSVYAFLNNQLDSSVTLAGQGGITIRADPATNTLFFVGPASNTYLVSTGIYGFNQIKVVDAASTITSSIQGWNGNFLTATSPSTLLNFIGYNDIQMSTNVTTNSIFFKISTFTSQGYLDISANAYGAYPSTLSTVSSLYVQQTVFNSTIGYLSSYTGFGFSSVVSSINALAMSTGDQFYILSGLIDARATIVQLNSYSNTITNEMYSTTIGLGTLGYISTGGGSAIGAGQLISTVEGLGSAGYLSTVGGIIGNITTANVVSTVQGLGTVGYVSSLSTITTSSIFNTGAISTYSLEVFGPATLTNSGSTILRGPIYLGGPTYIAGSINAPPNTLVTPANLNSTVQGLGTSRYISSSQLFSTIANLGSLGYLSSLRGFAISTGSVTASSINLLDPYTNALNYLTVSSGSLLVNGAKIEGGGGGGSGGVAQLVAGTGISLTPAGGTGVVTITNTGATTAYVNTAISSFSTALGPVNQGSGSYNFSTVSSVYGSSFVTNLLTASTMTTANILPSQSNLWVSVGYGSSATNSIQTSTDGLNWTDVSTGGFSSAGKGVAYNGSLWVSVGNNGSSAGSIQYSGDGKNWSNAVSGGFSSGGYGVAWNGSYWIAVGNNGSALTSIQISRDGRNWSGISSGGFSTRGEAVAWNGSYWVAVGLGGSQLAGLQYSLDGLNWVSASSGGFSAGGKGIAWNGSLWVAAGDDTTRPASLQYSGNGRNWSNCVSGGFLSAAWKVAWNGKLWVAVGDESTALKSIQTSLDGSNWSDIQSGGFNAGNDGYGIAWNGFYWIATGIGASATASIQRSFDGLNWTSVTSGGFSLGAVSVGFSSNLNPGYAQQNLTILSQNIPIFNTSTNQIMAQPSSLLINNTLTIDGKFNRLGVNCNTPAYTLDVNGIGHFLTLSTLGLQISSINGVQYNDAGSITSTVAGLGQNYVSTSGLVSTTRALQTSGFLSTPVMTSTVAGLGQSYISSLLNVTTVSTLVLNVSSINGALPGTGSGNGSSITVSTAAINASSIGVGILNGFPQAQLDVNGTGRFLTVSTLGLQISSINGLQYNDAGSITSTVAGLGQIYVSTSGLVSTTRGLQTSGFISTSALVSTTYGLQTSGFLSTSALVSTTYGLQTSGFLSTSALVSTTYGLQTSGFLSTSALVSTTYGLQTSGFLSTSALVSTTYGLQTSGFLSTSALVSTTYGLQTSGFLSTAVIQSTTAGVQLNLNSTITGLVWAGDIPTNTNNRGYVVTSQLTSTVAQLATGGGSSGAIPYISAFTVSTGQLFTSTIRNIVIPPTTLANRYFLALGTTTNNAAASIQYSTDGSNWVTTTGGFPYGATAAAWNGSNMWVAVGSPTNTQSLKYSGDGSNWSNTTGTFTGAGSGGSGLCVGWNGRVFVAGGFGGIGTTLANLKWSTDGMTFYDSVSGALSGIPYAIGWNGRMWLAGGTSIAMSYSYDGSNWATVNGNGVNALGIIWDGRKWVVASSSSGIYTSSDSVNWIRGNTTSFTANAVAYNGMMYVAVGFQTGLAAGNIKYSYDGLNWSNSVSGAPTGTACSVGWNGTFWEVTTNDANAPSIKWSRDGMNWTNSSSGGFANNNGSGGIAYTSNTTPSYLQTNFEITNDLYQVYIRSTNQLQFTVSSMMANGVTITNEGKVGIYRGSPEAELDVAGTGRFFTASTLALNISSINGGIYGNIPQFPSTVSTSYSISFATSSITNVSSITFGPGTLGWITAGAIQAVVISTVQQNTAVSYISSLYVGSTNINFLPFYTAQINGTASISSLLVGQAINPFSTIGYRLAITHDSAIKPGTTTWTTTSDMRMKEDITNADVDRCYTDVKALPLRRFTWQSSFIDSWGGTDKRVLGFIAQEVSTIVPKAVTIMNAYGYNDFQFLNTDQLNMSLFGAVKRTIQDKEYLESTVKGQAFELETLRGTTTVILSTLRGLQNQ